MTKKSIAVVDPMWTGRFFVRAIHESGFKPVVIFPRVENERIANEDYVLAKEYTDKYNPIYLNESDGVEALVRKLNELDTLAIACGCEIGVSLTDKLAKAIGAPGNSPATTELRRDKHHMQAALKENNLRHIQSRFIVTPEEAIEFAEEIGRYPIVLKPILSSGSDGLHFCRDTAELEKWTRSMLGRKNWSGSVNRGLLVQEYIKGKEYIINCVSRNGVHIMTDMWVYNKLTVGDSGICYDSIRLIKTLDERCLKMVEYIYQVLTALGFEYGPSHSELFWDENGPVLVETGARPMGGYMNENILTEAVGHYLADTALVSYINADKFQSLLEKMYTPMKELMEKYFITLRHEKLKSIPAMQLLRKLQSVREIRIRDAIEHYCTEETVDYFSSPGFVLLCHEDSEVLVKDYRLIRSLEEKYPMLLFEGGGEGACPILNRNNPMIFSKTSDGYIYNGEGDVADLETAFFEFNKIVEKMIFGQYFRITNEGIRALGIPKDAVQVALEILGLVMTNSQSNGELSFVLQ
jgi:biotin carboxylase